MKWVVFIFHNNKIRKTIYITGVEYVYVNRAVRVESGIVAVTAERENVLAVHDGDVA